MLLGKLKRIIIASCLIFFTASLFAASNTDLTKRFLDKANEAFEEDNIEDAYKYVNQALAVAKDEASKADVLFFAKSVLRNHIEGVISDELALDAYERALELNLGDAEDAFILRKMGIIYKRIGDERTADICFEEADRLGGAKRQ